MIEIYIDGAYSRKMNKGSFAVLCFNGGSEECVYKKTGIIRYETSNVAELLGLVASLEICIQAKSRSFKIYCDSKYTVNSYTQWVDRWESRGWKKKGGKIKNLEIMKKIFNLKREILILGKRLEVVWVKGHAGDPRNEMADQEAKNLVY